VRSSAAEGVPREARHRSTVKPLLEGLDELAERSRDLGEINHRRSSLQVITLDG
jgi:hypothetical protein